MVLDEVFISGIREHGNIVERRWMLPWMALGVRMGHYDLLLIQQQVGMR